MSLNKTMELVACSPKNHEPLSSTSKTSQFVLALKRADVKNRITAPAQNGDHFGREAVPLVYGSWWSLFVPYPHQPTRMPAISVDGTPLRCELWYYKRCPWCPTGNNPVASNQATLVATGSAHLGQSTYQETFHSDSFSQHWWNVEVLHHADKASSYVGLKGIPPVKMAYLASKTGGTFHD